MDSLVTTEIETKRPVSDVVSLVDECDFEPHFVETLCDMLFRVCADNRMFRDALKVFDYVIGAYDDLKLSFVGAEEQL